MKKICFLVEYLTYKGGGERVYTNMANTFIKNGYDVTIASIESSNKTAYPLDDKIKIKNLNLRPEYYYKDKNRKLLDIINFPRYISSINKNLADYDVIISIGANANILLSYLKTNAKKIGTEHIGYDFVNIIVKIMRYLRYKQLDCLTVLTKVDELRFEKNMNLKVKAIPNQSSFNLNEISVQKNNKIINVASLHYQKNQERLIELFSKIHMKYPEWKLEIYGEGPLRSSLEELIKSKKLDHKVKLLGNVDNIEKKMLDSDIFCFTSRYEGFPMVLLEAMECGLPVVSFDCPTGPKEIIENNETGYLIDIENDEEYLVKLEKLIQSRELRIEMGKVAKERVKIYSEENIFKLWQEVIN